MTTDFRLSTSYPSHPKVQKLERRLGAGAVLCHLTLLAWTAENRPKGVLVNMTSEDVEIVARWAGKEGLFVETLIELRLLDRVDDTLAVHDWSEHNPWVAEAPGRRAFAQRQNHRRWHAERGISEPATCALCRDESLSDQSDHEAKSELNQSTEISTDKTEISRPSVKESSFPFLSNSKDSSDEGKPKAKPRKSRLTDEWQPKRSTREWAAEKYGDLDFDGELTAFRDWHIGKGSTWVDWDRALRGWIRRAAERPASQHSRVQARTVAVPVVTELADYLNRGAK